MKNKVFIFGLLISFAILSFGGTMGYSQELVVEELKNSLGNMAAEGETIEEPVIELSLQATVEYALENSKELRIQKIELEKAELAFDQSEDAIEDQKDTFELLESSPVPRRFTVTPDFNVNRSFIKNGGAMKQAEFALNFAQWNYEVTENNLVFSVEKAYFDLLQVEKEFRIAEENLMLAMKQYDNGMLRFELGMISKQQLLGLEFSLSQAQSGYESAKMYYGLQKMSFRNTIGLQLDEEFELTDTIEYREYEPIILDDAIEAGLENNAGVMTAEANLEVQKLLLEATIGRFPPITYRYRTQEQEVMNAEMNLQTAKNGVEMQVRSAVLNLTTAEKQIATYEKAVYQASEGVRIAELSFELGQNTPTEVAQANLNLMNAKKNLAQQIHAFNMALLDYKYSIGIGKGF